MSGTQKDCCRCFNTQPPEGGCRLTYLQAPFQPQVSTHSHPKVAATNSLLDNRANMVSTHSHPKVAAKEISIVTFPANVSTHSHPKVAADFTACLLFLCSVSTHSHPKVAAPYIKKQDKSAN